MQNFVDSIKKIYVGCQSPFALLLEKAAKNSNNRRNKYEAHNKCKQFMSSGIKRKCDWGKHEEKCQKKSNQKRINQMEKIETDLEKWSN